MKSANHATISALAFSGLLFGDVAFGLNVSVLDYGAVGNGVINDRSSIQSAIAAVNAGGGGTVTVPYRATCTNSNGVCNTYLTGNLTLESNVTLTITTGTSLQQSQNSADYTYTPVVGHAATSALWDTAVFLNLPFIYGASGTTNVGINGWGDDSAYDCFGWKRQHDSDWPYRSLPCERIRH
jgi:hypothetical protein